MPRFFPPSEAQLKQQIKQRLNEWGYWYFMPVPSGRGRAGIPDFIICCLGHLVAIETKAPDPSRKPTAAQLRELKAIQASRGTALVIRSIEQFEQIFKDLHDSYTEYRQSNPDVA